jgi:hypothetical protein
MIDSGFFILFIYKKIKPKNNQKLYYSKELVEIQID